MIEKDAATNEVIEEGQECFFLENEGVYIADENKMKEYLFSKGWTPEEIEEARTSDLDEEGEPLGNEVIYFTTYEG